MKIIVESGWEMQYFYEEQKQRLEFLNHEVVIFEDIVCQMYTLLKKSIWVIFRADMFKPEKEIHYTLDLLKKNKDVAGVFFNILTNLNKFVAYEQRDPF